MVMSPTHFSDYQLRLREQQRKSLLSWIVERTSEPSIVTGQTVSVDKLNQQLQAAQASVTAVLDEPGGERLYLTIHPNGSVILELKFDELSELDDALQSSLQSEVSQMISDLFHADALQFLHSLVQQAGCYLLKTVTSQAPGRELAEVASETLALHEYLLEYIHARLTQAGEGA